MARSQLAIDMALIWRLTVAALQRFTTERMFGSLWWILDPLIMIAVYVVVLSGILGAIRPGAQDTYPLFLACGLIPWRWNAVATTRAANAFLANSGLLTATPINRDAVYLAEFGASSVQALMGIPVLFGFMIYYDRAITINLLWLPVPLFILGVLICGIGYGLCGLTVLLRDTGNAYAAFLRLLWFLSPGLYSLDRIPEQYRQLYCYANPFAGILEGIRRPIHDGLPPNWEALTASAVWAVVVLLLGRIFFLRLKNDAIRML